MPLSEERKRFIEAMPKEQRDVLIIEAALGAPVSEARRRFIEKMPQEQRDVLIIDALTP